MRVILQRVCSLQDLVLDLYMELNMKAVFDSGLADAIIIVFLQCASESLS